jgi:hypothetical protein
MEKGHSEDVGGCPVPLLVRVRAVTRTSGEASNKNASRLRRRPHYRPRPRPGVVLREGPGGVGADPQLSGPYVIYPNCLTDWSVHLAHSGCSRHWFLFFGNLRDQRLGG